LQVDGHFLCFTPVRKKYSDKTTNFFFYFHVLLASILYLRCVVSWANRGKEDGFFFVTPFTNGEVEPCYKSSFLGRWYMWQFKLFYAACFIL